MTEDGVVVKVIEAIAESDSIDPSEVDYTLAEYINPEVLEELGNMEGGVWELAFRVSDHHVRLTHDGAIIVDGVNHTTDNAVQE